MFNDDFWTTLTCVGVGVGAYFYGKGHGVTKGADAVRTEVAILNQQHEIAELKKQIKALTVEKQKAISSQPSSAS